AAADRVVPAVVPPRHAKDARVHLDELAGAEGRDVLRDLEPPPFDQDGIELSKLSEEIEIVFAVLADVRDRRKVRRSSHRDLSFGRSALNPQAALRLYSSAQVRSASSRSYMVTVSIARRYTG